MFGGDWPVSLLGASYRDTVSVAANLFAALSAADARSLWGGTAERVYRR